MTYRIEFRPAALRDLKALPREILQRVSEKIAALAENPRPVGVESYREMKKTFIGFELVSIGFSIQFKTRFY